MSTGIDARIGALLRQAAPAPQDPMFRLRVLERRERQRFRHKALLLGVAALAVMAAAAIGYGARAALIERLGVVLLCTALIASCLAHARVVAYFLRLLRSPQQS